MDTKEAEMNEIRCYLFIDNSNLWIEGQKFSALKLKLSDADHDPRYRIDLGSFLQLVVGKRSIAQAFLFGSTPPPNDSVWRAARQKNFTVKTFERAMGVPYGREKEVDVAMATQITRLASKCDEDDKENTVFIIVTGDRDFKAPVENAVEEKIHVEMWAWKTGMNVFYRQMANRTKLLKVKEIDDVEDKVSFTSYKSTRDKMDVAPDHSIVLKDIPNTRADKEIVVDCLFRMLRLFYIIEMPSTTEGLLDFLVEFPKSKPDVVLKQMSRSSSILSGIAISYPQYLTERKGLLTCELITRTQYQTLENDATTDYETTAEAVASSLNGSIDDLLEPAEGDEDDGTWTTHIRRRAGAWTQRKKQREIPCRWGIHCAKGSDCGYHHDERERKLFAKFPSIQFQFWKVKCCKKEKVHSADDCLYAHSEADAWCLCCKSSGHFTSSCAGRSTQ